jgi:hypothetical protein
MLLNERAIGAMFIKVTLLRSIPAGKYIQDNETRAIANLIIAMALVL